MSDLRESGCLAGDTIIRDAVTGKAYTIEELAHRQQQTPFPVHAVRQNLKIDKHTMVKAFYSGKKTVYELKTRSGRTIKASANHPFLRIDGWTPLEKLLKGDKIAIPRKLNFETTHSPMADNEDLEEIDANPNLDIIPKEAWQTVIKDAKESSHVSWRKIQEGLGMSYCGSSLFKSGISRQRMRALHEALPSTELYDLAHSDLYWDEISSITKMEEEDVYDLTVEGAHNFVANDILVHNSIEQDADVVIFLVRREYYDPYDRPGQAELIVAKNRHGGIGNVTLTYQKEIARFVNYSQRDPTSNEAPPSNARYQANEPDLAADPAY
jgi:replicative DNA helicase